MRVARIIHRGGTEAAEKNGVAWACAKTLRGRGLQSYAGLDFSASSASQR